MRLGTILAAMLWMSACAPPDPFQEIDILFPTPEDDFLFIDEQGTGSTLLVVNIDGFTLLPEGDADASLSTEGHWHLFINGVYQRAISDGFTTDIEILGLTDGQELSISVALARDNHQELRDEEGNPIQSVIELVATPLPASE
ncbi:MAG: hypothetical protein ACJATT_004607 [Myxococcota bacterium]